MKNHLYFDSWQSLYSRMRIKSKTAYDINIMEDNFALRYVFTHPGIISRAKLVPSNGASRRRLGDEQYIIISPIIFWHGWSWLQPPMQTN